MPDYLHQSCSQLKWWKYNNRCVAGHFVIGWTMSPYFYDNCVSLRKIQVAFKCSETLHAVLHVSIAGIADWLRDIIMFWAYNIPQFYHVIYSRGGRSFCEVIKHVKMGFLCSCLILKHVLIEVVWTTDTILSIHPVPNLHCGIQHQRGFIAFISLTVVMVLPFSG